MAVFWKSYGQKYKKFKYGNLYNHKGIKMSGRQYIFAKEVWFDLKISIYAMNLKLHISQLLFLYLSKTSNQIVACVGLESVKHYCKYTFEIWPILCYLQINFSIQQQR